MTARDNEGKADAQVCVGFTVWPFAFEAATRQNQSLSFIILILSTLAHTDAYRIMSNETTEMIIISSSIGGLKTISHLDGWSIDDGERASEWEACTAND